MCADFLKAWSGADQTEGWANSNFEKEKTQQKCTKILCLSTKFGGVEQGLEMSGA